MRLHFLSRGYAVPLAFHSRVRGAKCTAYIPEVLAGDGLIEKTADPQPPARDCVVIVDGAGWNGLPDALAQDGYRVLFGGRWAELVVGQDIFQARVLQSAGIEPVVRDVPYRVVVGAWHEDGLREPFYQGILRDRQLAGDAGLLVGPMGAELMPLDPDSDFCGHNLRPLEPTLKKAGYRGLVTAFLNPDDFTFSALVVGVQPQIIEALCEMVYGGFPGLVGGEKAGGDVAVSLAVTAPDIVEIRPDGGQQKRTWPLDFAANETGWISQGTMPYLLSVTARGCGSKARHAAFCQAAGRAYRTLERLNIPNAQYRSDIGYRADACLP